MFGKIKEKLRLSVYKAVIVKKVGSTEIKNKTVYTLNSENKPEKKTVWLNPPVIVDRYRIVKVKYVDPNKDFFKHTVGSRFSRNKVTKFLPIDFTFESYTHNEKHVMFVDWSTGAVAQLGGGQIEYAYPPEEEAVKSSLMRSVGDLLRGKMDTAMVLMALGLGVFLGIFIQGTLIPLLGAV